MKIIFGIILATVLGSCSRQREIIGTWKVKNYTLWERGTAFIFKGVTGFPVGTELKLNPDSTFRETSCGNICSGKWNIKEDSLILKIDTGWFRNYVPQAGDSIHSPLNHGLLKYVIKGNKLIQYSTGKYLAAQGDSSRWHYSKLLEILK